jgi:rare lipoprotein A
VALGTTLLFWSITGFAGGPPPNSPEAKEEAHRLSELPPVTPQSHIDHSGRKQKGKASYYANHFAGHKTASGKPFHAGSNMAASKTLPLGTTAKVTNAQNGKSVEVKIEDRGPYVDGRIVDLAPEVANKLEMKKSGVTPVEVAPIAVPQQNGPPKLGAGAADANAQHVEQAARETGAAGQ